MHNSRSSMCLFSVRMAPNRALARNSTSSIKTFSLDCPNFLSTIMRLNWARQIWQRLNFSTVSCISGHKKRRLPASCRSNPATPPYPASVG
ncbi:hypothetical protein BGLA2_420047 [Burkholderia gladioli]|nr:hypothetical protein BGLA2_420047 [Burkholderia gladioli]